jgi:hypothetical protein
MVTAENCYTFYQLILGPRVGIMFPRRIHESYGEAQIARLLSPSSSTSATSTSSTHHVSRPASFYCQLNCLLGKSKKKEKSYISAIDGSLMRDDMSGIPPPPLPPPPPPPPKFSAISRRRGLLMILLSISGLLIRF